MTGEQRQRAALVLKAIAHPVRLGVLELLAKGEKSASELIVELDCSQSAMSQQLDKLARQELVAVRREGSSKFYSLRNPDLLSMFTCLEKHLANYLAV